MLVDINLLPQKEEKSRFLLVLLIVVGFVLGAGLFSTFYYAKHLDNKTASVNQEITATKHLLETAQRQLAGLSESSAVAELENAVQWAEAYRTKTVPLIQQLTTILPERGFIDDFTYQVPGVVSLTVQFDTNREAAYFLNNLHEADWITEAKLDRLSTKELKDGDEEEADKYLPRYIGYYKIQINKAKFEQLLADSQGGDA